MRTRIIGLAVWASVLAIALFGVPLAVAVLQYAVQAERNELERIADAIAITVAEDVYDGEQIDSFTEPAAAAITVYDDEGRQLSSSGPRVGGPELSPALSGSVGIGDDDRELVVAVPVTHEDEVIGVVRAAAPRSAVLQEVGLAWAVMATLAALAVAIAWLVGRRQARHLAGPLEELATAARRLGDGDFTVRARHGRIPEIDSVGAALNATAGRLDDLLTTERRFSADASHQLRTPLAGLRLRLEAALERPDTDPRTAIAASLADTDRLEATIDELLALARHQRGADTGPLDLRAVLHEPASEWRARLALQDRHLDLAIDDGVPTPRASAAAVRQILAVLLDNASTHGSGTVTVVVREATGAVAIDVSDEGPGIPDPDTALSGRPPAQGHDHGIGLGLAQRLAESIDARLLLSRRTPPVFTLLLPPASASGTSSPQPSTSPAPALERVGRSGPHRPA